jgi:glutaredoxin 3
MALTIYTTPTCGYCHKAKAFLQQRHIPYTEVDVSRDQRRAEEMVRKSGQMGVPVIDVNGKIIVGFNQGEIERALKQ